MKKIFIALFVVAASLSASAKVVILKSADGSNAIFTTSQLGAIEIASDGSISASTFDGTALENLGKQIVEVDLNDDIVVTETFDETLIFGVSGIGDLGDINLSSRQAKIINYLYPSVDPDGNPITLSGSITIPENVYNGEARVEGILLFNHFTVCNKAEAPTRGYRDLEQLFLANPLNLNYISVESDFYGFGATERFPQAYLYGTANGRASIDALDAAYKVLDELGFDCGKFLFNMGYSSGGFEAMATLKYADQISTDGKPKFDKTYAGGGPYDLRTAYDEVVGATGTVYLVSLPLMVVAFNESGHLGLDYHDIFQPFLADNIGDWILSKNYSSWDINDLIGREKTPADILMPDYLDGENAKADALLKVFDEKSIATDWVPNPENKIYLFHSQGDDYVSYKCAIKLVEFLEQNGFTASMLPGVTNLQTNFTMENTGHLMATLEYVVQVAAELKLWPYVKGDANPLELIAELRNFDFDAKKIISLMQALGLSADQMVAQLVASGFSVEQIVASFAEAGLDLTRAFELLKGYGIDFDAFAAKIVAGELSLDELLSAYANGALDEDTIMEFLTKAGVDVPAIVAALEEAGIDTDQLFAALAALLDSLNGNNSADAPELTKAVRTQHAAQVLTPVYADILHRWLDDNGVKRD